MVNKSIRGEQYAEDNTRNAVGRHGEMRESAGGVYVSTPPTSVGGSTMYNAARLLVDLSISAADAIPVAGSPVKAALGGLVKVLDRIEVSDDEQRKLKSILTYFEATD